MTNKLLKLILLQLFVFQAFAQKEVTVLIDTEKPTVKISPKMWGIFFEDINFGADGGLYAELIKNRSFEFAKPLTGWQVIGTKNMYGLPFNGEVTVVNDIEKTETNPRYLKVKLNNTQKGSLGIENEGFRGIGVKKGLEYDFSVLSQNVFALTKLYIELLNDKNEIIGTSKIDVPQRKMAVWAKSNTTIIPSETCQKAKLRIWFEGNGEMKLDMISLFPRDTYKGRKGGLRADMVQILADMKPGFIRFPGGCIVEGRDLAARYEWKKTIGYVENRKMKINRWNDEMGHRLTPDYFQTFGLGFYEYFQMAEDIGAEPLPILNCGMACQFNSAELVDMKKLDPYVQDALDLIEFANGLPKTKWGKIRADMGHPQPFNMKMLGIGNENWGPQYLERLEVFKAKVSKKYPNIKLVGSAGIASEGPMFNMLDSAIRKMEIAYIDEHYYNRPEWFLANARRYDNYDRKSKTKVFAGEYAGQSDKVVSVNNKNNWQCAIAEAAFMTGLERNGDVVEMASYAPLFGHAEAWQWKPNLIWVDNLNVLPTPNYYVQKLFANNVGNESLAITNENGITFAGQDSLYISGSFDKTSNTLNLKVVNTSKSAKKAQFHVAGDWQLPDNAEVIRLQNNDLEVENTFEKPNQIVPVTTKISIAEKSHFSFNLQQTEFVVIKIKLKKN